jgi:hypothetical protein
MAIDQLGYGLAGDAQIIGQPCYSDPQWIEVYFFKNFSGMNGGHFLL